ncbi:hypothetical protein [Yinghuangia sp. YIM S09857]|uniref:PH-like domain-containing protein n=1 Tax=Yinghuangia sp. YIM S09857 TaxID=3436929 RepID=UPI003F5301F7
MNTSTGTTVLLAAEKKSAEVSDWGQYLLWTGIFVVLIGGVYVLMWRAWKKRGRRQADLPAPAAAPDDPGTPLLPTLTGRYFGCTTAGHWLDRIVAHGLGTRSAVDLTLTDRGLTVHRYAAAGFFIPASDLVEARFEKAAGGKVLPEGGLLVVTWKLGDTLLDCAFRGGRVAEHDAWVDAVNRLAAGDRPAAAVPGAQAAATAGQAAHPNANDQEGTRQ